MVTVVDPSGTPVIAYNKTGITIVEATGGAPGSPTAITALSGTTIVLTTRPGGGGDAYQLPANADVGDVAEYYATDASGPDIYAPSGETILPGTASRAISANGGRFRKISATQWAGN